MIQSRWHYTRVSVVTLIEVFPQDTSPDRMRMLLSATHMGLPGGTVSNLVGSMTFSQCSQ